MIPKFPDSKKLEISDKHDIEQLTKKFQPYNDFEFIDLWIYNPEESTTISILYNNLIIKRQDYISAKVFYTFLGAGNTRETISILLNKSKEEGLKQELCHVPEANLTLSHGIQEHFSIVEDEDNFDYILSVSEIAELNESKYHNKRNLVKLFEKHHPTFSIRKLDLQEEEVRKEIIDLFYLWEEQKGKKRSETEIELTAIQKLFEIAHLCDVTGLGVYIDNELIGVSTYHLLPGKFAGISLEKGNTNFQGVYSFLKHETAKVLRELGCEYINYEQDLGIPGMKHAKQLWRPVFYLKKYTIAEKS